MHEDPARLRVCMCVCARTRALALTFLRERERDRTDRHAEAGGAAGAWLRGGGSVDLATGFECPLGGTAIDLDVGLSPGDDVARKGLGAAGGQVVHLPWGQLSVPDVEMGQLTHECLGGVEPATQSVLQRKTEDESEGRGWGADPAGGRPMSPPSEALGVQPYITLSPQRAQEKGRCWSLLPWMQSFSWGDSWTLPVLQPVTQPARKESAGAMDDLGARPWGTSPPFLLLGKALDVTLPATAAPREPKAWDSAASSSIPDTRWETNHSQEINHLLRKARVAFQSQRELCCSPGGLPPHSGPCVLQCPRSWPPLEPLRDLLPLTCRGPPPSAARSRLVPAA